MTRYVVDASVVAKWFIPEVHSADALRYLDDANELAAPDLLLPETANILWKKLRRHEIEWDVARRIARAVRTAPIRIQPSEPLMDAALDLAVRLDRSAYDSLYLVLAISGQCRLVTADRRLYNALQGGPCAGDVRWVEEKP
jgi:predicted nucleic acid-binding protein